MPPIILPATRQEHDTLLRNLYQFYTYEYTRFMPWHVSAGGRFHESDLDGCWEEGTQIFLLWQEAHPAGFAIIEVDVASETLPDVRVRYMLEFFIMAACQRQGLGEHLARFCFDRLPGRWEVTELKENTAAQAFWRKCIGRYTGGRYEEAWLDEGAVLLQQFDTADRVSSSLGEAG
ncbi:MAG: GNAT family N-acetyltransferase [Anaerolineae bacterium]|nr:GNAT family N-acetyltransferase [Anaerolineae bacterium]